METCQTKSTPMNPKQVLNRRPDKEPPDEETKARFATAIGSLMYLMVGTRLDIAFALGTLSRFTSQPQSPHQAPVSWSSKRQGEVPTSTTHAEYIG